MSRIALVTTDVVPDVQPATTSGILIDLESELRKNRSRLIAEADTLLAKVREYHAAIRKIDNFLAVLVAKEMNKSLPIRERRKNVRAKITATNLVCQALSSGSKTAREVRDFVCTRRPTTHTGTVYVTLYQLKRHGVVGTTGRRGNYNYHIITKE